MNQKNNVIDITGTIVTPFTFSHEVYGEKFYSVGVQALRESGNIDTLNVVISSKIIDVSKDMYGTKVDLYGQLRTRNETINNKTHLQVYLFVQEIELFNELVHAKGLFDKNLVELDGYICKTPVYRKTPKGRAIADILVAVNRPYGKSDYIPCIAWGRNATMSERLGIGQHIQLKGRLQSREYEKKLSETESETRIAYEVSINNIDIVEG